MNAIATMTIKLAIASGFKACSILGLMSLAIVSIVPSSEATSLPSTASTQQLEQQALSDFQSGRYLAALKQWQSLEQNYLKRDPFKKLNAVKINQSLALQALGESKQACLQLVEVLALEPQFCQAKSSPQASHSKSLPLRPKERFFSHLYLSQVLNQLGQPKTATAQVQAAQKVALRLQNQDYLNLAKFEQTQIQQSQLTQKFNQLTLIDNIAEVNQKLNQFSEEATDIFSTYETLSQTPSLKSQAQLSWLEHYSFLRQVQNRGGLTQARLTSLLQPYHTKVEPIFPNLLSSTQQFNISEKFTHNQRLIQFLLSDHRQAINSLPGPLFIASSLVQENLQLSLQNQNRSQQAIAYQHQGDLYEAQNKSSQAQGAFLKAQQLSQQTSNWDILYKSSAGLAQLYEAENQIPDAIAAYDVAINSLDKLRNQRASRPIELQYSFQEEVEPIYHRYLKRLLQSQNPDYRKIIRLNEQLRIAELINYLQCGYLELESLTKAPRNKPATFIHFLSLEDEFHVIAQLSSGKFRHYTVDNKSVDTALSRLLINIKGDGFAYSNERQFQSLSQPLYQLLLSPLAADLAPDTTIVFSLDSKLQQLPLALLYDGNQYLIEKHQISTNFGLQAPKLEQLKTSKPKALIAGLSGVSPSFQQVEMGQLQPLFNINRETQYVAKLTQKSDVLLNQTFTVQELQRKLDQQRFPILHIATHGSFSSDPDETYLLAWDKKIQLQDLEQLLQTPSDRGMPIELLVLSACETAQGDRRATLGLAGLATQSGALTTVATLWKVDDEATSLLMAAFYRNLAQGKSKAEALQMAQLQLKNSAEYQSPFFWAPFILSGHWQ